MFDGWTRSEIIGVGSILVQIGGFGMTLVVVAMYVGGMKVKVDAMWTWFQGHDAQISDSIEAKVGHTVRGALQNFYLRLDEMDRKIGRYGG